MTVGWYVHHHGAGHGARLRATLPHLDGVTAFSSVPLAGVERQIELPADTTPAPVDQEAGGTLHWAPVGHPGHRERLARIAAWIQAEQPSAFVIDVSVEVALLVRLLGVPTVVVAQRGRRTDPPHALAYRQAAAIVAPWTTATRLEDEPLPAERTAYVGAISRLDGRLDSAPAGGDDVLLLVGAGGHAITAAQVEAAAATTPTRTWHVAGPVAPEAPNVICHGPGADVGALLERCRVVVGTAGGNVVAEVAAARRAFVCLPQERPFGEQRSQGEALRRLGVAEVLPAWPAPAAWPDALRAAEARDLSRWKQLHDGQGAARLAAVVRDAATGSAP